MNDLMHFGDWCFSVGHLRLRALRQDFCFKDLWASENCIGRQGLQHCGVQDLAERFAD